MRETVSISLPEEIKTQLDQAVREEGLSRSDIVRQAINDFLFVRRFRTLRARMMSQAQAQGVFTDDDVFELIS
jgi:metal-responsive CopG/Arc/MetJ family transcriptional regulator